VTLIIPFGVTAIIVTTRPRVVHALGKDVTKMFVEHVPRKDIVENMEKASTHALFVMKM